VSESSRLAGRQGSSRTHLALSHSRPRGFCLFGTFRPSRPSARALITFPELQRRSARISRLVRGRDLGSFVKDVQANIARQVRLPAGYSIEYGGQFENQERATTRLMVIIPVVIFLIYVPLYLTFKSFKQALLVIGNIPFALVGGIAALWLRGMNLNLSASVGFIALFGVAMLNGVVLVSSINQSRESYRRPMMQCWREHAAGSVRC
jgi:Cu/Ag efflux pump CusA